MALQQIDAKMLSKMFLAGAKNLENKKEWINELNVFPVPDGDTGTNMTDLLYTDQLFAVPCLPFFLFHIRHILHVTVFPVFHFTIHRASCGSSDCRNSRNSHCHTYQPQEQQMCRIEKIKEIFILPPSRSVVEPDQNKGKCCKHLQAVHQ